MKYFSDVTRKIYTTIYVDGLTTKCYGIFVLAWAPVLRVILGHGLMGG